MRKPIVSEELKAEAIKKAMEPGSQVKEIAKGLGVSTTSLYVWIRRHKQATNPSPLELKQAALEEENAQLKAELTAVKRELFQSQEGMKILKKTQAYFLNEPR